MSDNPMGNQPTASTQSESPSETGGPMQVLVVDDDEDFVTLAATLLESESEIIETVTETSPQAVVDEHDLSAVDCIVSDYLMPEMDGIEFLDAIRERHAQLPFILFTGKGSESVVEEAMAAGVSDYIVKDGSPDQYAISANRIEQLVTQYRTHQTLRRTRTLDDLRASVSQAVLTAPTRDEIEQEVCDQFVETELFSVAWIGERDPQNGTIRPRVWAGDQQLREAVSFSTARAPQTAEEQALDTGAASVEPDLAAESDDSQWASTAVDHGYAAAAAVPISYEGIPYGVFGVYTGRPGFSADDRAVIESVADLMAFAIGASERRQGDTSRQVVDIEFDVSSTDLPFVRIAETLGSAVELTQTLTQSNGTALTRYRILDATAASADELGSLLAVESVRLFERAETDDELAVVSTEPWWDEIAGLYGARVGNAVADAGGATLRVELPPTATVRAVVDLISERFPGAQPISRQERTRPTQSLDELHGLLADRLTDRQREVIETAYHAGYFEWPHATASESVAELLGITQPTFAEHFWTAQQQIIALLLEDDETASTS